MNIKKITVLLLGLILIAGTLCPASFAETDIILSPANGEVLYESPSVVLLNTEGFSETAVYLDGEIYSENAESEVFINESLALGEHSLKAVGILSDGTAKCEEVNFTVKYQSVNGVGEWKEEMVTFDSLDSKYDESYPMDADMADEFSEKFGWNLIYTHPSGTDPLTRTLTRIEGKNHSSNENDYAPLLSYGEVSDTAWSGQGGMVFAGSEKTRESMLKTGGIYTLEFDMMTFDNSPTIFLYLPFAMWGETSYNGQYLLTNGSAKLRDTNTTITPNEWHSYKMQYDISGDKWNVWFDGAHVVEDIAARTDYHNTDLVRLEIVAKKGAQNKFAIDNFKMTHEKIYDGVKWIEFVSPLGISKDKNSFSPDVSEIKITLSDKFDFLKSEDITFKTAEDRKIESEITYDKEKGVLSIFPKKNITPNCDMEIVCSNASMPADFVYKIRSGAKVLQEITYKADEKDVYSVKQLEGCKELSCNANISLADGVESFEGVYVLTIRQNEKIVAMAMEEVSLSSGKTSDNIKLKLSLLEKAENSDIMLMLCDSLTGCVAQSKYIKLK